MKRYPLEDQVRVLEQVGESQSIFSPVGTEIVFNGGLLSPFPEVRSLAVKSLTRRHRPDISNKLKGLFITEKDGRVGAAIIHAVSRTEKGETLEKFLLSALKRTDEKVKMAAAIELGPVGTMAAVPALQNLISGLALGQLERAAKTSIRKIQSRMDPSLKGALEIQNEMDSGWLGLAEEGGSLSLDSSKDAAKEK